MNGSYMVVDFSAAQRRVMEVTHRRFVGNIYKCFLFPGGISRAFCGTSRLAEILLTLSMSQFEYHLI
jgi:hypothetical protein